MFEINRLTTAIIGGSSIVSTEQISIPVYYKLESLTRAILNQVAPSLKTIETYVFIARRKKLVQEVFLQPENKELQNDLSKNILARWTSPPVAIKKNRFAKVMEQNVHHRLVDDGIMEVLKDYDARHETFTFFKSNMRADQLEILIIRISATELIRFYSSHFMPFSPSYLSKAPRIINGMMILMINKNDPSLSLITKSIEEILRGLFDDTSPIEAPSEIAKSAGREIVSTILDQFTDVPLYQESESFDLFSYISSIPHEGNQCRGYLVIAPQNSKSITVSVNFCEPILLKNVKGVRKLLQITSEELMLLYDGEFIYGLGSIRTLVQDQDFDWYIIQFLEAHKWQLSVRSTAILQVSMGGPSMPGHRFDINCLNAKLRSKSAIWGINAQQVDILISLVQDAVSLSHAEKHGAMLVISAEAANEARRLKRQSTIIEPVPFGIVRYVLKMDGAVLLDINADCHGFGVILDGTASEELGDSARGARYNSALRYVNSHKENCLVVVISEDGWVDIISS